MRPSLFDLGELFVRVLSIRVDLQRVLITPTADNSFESPDDTKRDETRVVQSDLAVARPGGAK